MKSWWKPFKHGAEYALFRTVFGGLSLSPSWLQQHAGSWVLSAAGKIKLNPLALRNLDLAFGDTLNQKQKEHILRGVHSHLGRLSADLARSYSKGLDSIRTRVEFDTAWPTIQKILQQGKGLIVVTPHFGNWEWIPACFALAGNPGVVVGKRLKNRRLNDFLTRAREKSGAEIIFQHESPRKILRVLRQGRPVGLLPDADTTRLEGIFLPFFGRPTYTPTGPASLSILSGAPILPVFLLFEGDKYRLHTGEPIFPQSKQRNEEEIARLSLHWTQAFEEMIRKHPEQWVWFQRRWVNTPESVAHSRKRL